MKKGHRSQLGGLPERRDSPRSAVSVQMQSYNRAALLSKIADEVNGVGRWYRASQVCVGLAGSVRDYNVR